MESQLSIALSEYAADYHDYVIIDQEPWAKDVARTSKSQGIMAIGSMIFGGSLPLPNCGSLSGFDTPVYVYPSRVDLNYKFAVSHGQFMPAIAKTMIREEIIKCGLQDSAETKYPVASMLSMQWVGNCYDTGGSILPRPVVTRQGRTLLFNAKVYGSIRVKYSVYRRAYKVRIEERDDSIENNFQCAAYVVWDGGVVFEEIEAPSGYDDTKGNCGNGIYDGVGTGPGGSGSVEICQPEWGQGTYPAAVRADRHTKVDFCSQETMSDTITESTETENTPGAECSDGPLVTN